MEIFRGKRLLVGGHRCVCVCLWVCVFVCVYVCVCLCLMQLFSCRMAEWMRMEHWQNDSERGKPQYLEKNLSHSHFVHHKFHMDWLWWKPIDWTPQVWHSCNYNDECHCPNDWPSSWLTCTPVFKTNLKSMFERFKKDSNHLLSYSCPRGFDKHSKHTNLLLTQLRNSKFFAQKLS